MIGVSKAKAVKGRFAQDIASHNDRERKEKVGGSDNTATQHCARQYQHDGD